MDSLKFVPFSSSINPGFWSELAKIKLDVSGLNEEPLDINNVDCFRLNSADDASAISGAAASVS